MAALSEAEVKKMTVPLLKKELSARGLPTSGRKADLSARLLEHLAEQSSDLETTTEPTVAAPAAPVQPVQAVAVAKPAVAAKAKAKAPTPKANGASSDKVERRADGKKKKDKKKKKKRQEQPEPTAEEEEVSAIEIEYEPEALPEPSGDPALAAFADIFDRFKTLSTAPVAEAEVGDTPAAATEGGDAEDEMNEGDDEDNEAKMSKRQWRKHHRMTVAELKQAVERPDVVELHDAHAADPQMLVFLKAYRNTVPVPQHWANKRKYLQGKRGFEKTPFDLPEFIKRTGITEMREALAEKEAEKGIKARMREKVRPKMGKIDIDYSKLHDAFFRWQTKPKMTMHGDLYYEGKEMETKLGNRKPGNLSKGLKEALGMPTLEDAPSVPPPWLLHMQRFGPPPSYPNLTIPGLNSPIPPGSSFGYHPGGWGKPPVDAAGKPLYGDVFGTYDPELKMQGMDLDVDKTTWGKMESEAEESSDEEESEGEEAGEEQNDEDDDAEGLETPSGIISEAPSGISSVGVGLQTPNAVDLRKRQAIEEAMDSNDTQTLYKVIPQRDASAGKGMMGSTHTYDVNAAAPASGMASGHTSVAASEGVAISLDNPEDVGRLEANQDMLAQKLAAARKPSNREDMSDMVAEHQAKAAAKRKKTTSDKTQSKKFKF